VKEPARTLIVYSSKRGHAEKLARAVFEGVRRTPSRATLAEASPEAGADAFSMVFIGFEESAPQPIREFVESNDWTGKKVAFFGADAGFDALSKKLGEAGAEVLGSLNAHVTGFLSFLGFGDVSEQDLIRARGFGERTTNTAFYFRVGGNKEKHRIKGYLKD